MIPLENLVSEANPMQKDAHSTATVANFEEAKGIQKKTSLATFAPAGNYRHNGAKLGFFHMCLCLNKGEFLKELTFNPLICHARYTESVMTPTENGAPNEKERVYLFKFDIRLAHLRIAYLDFFEENESVDRLMTPHTQFFLGAQSNRIHKASVAQMFKDTSADSIFKHKLGDLNEIAIRITGKPPSGSRVSPWSVVCRYYQVRPSTTSSLK